MAERLQSSRYDNQSPSTNQ